MTDFNRDWPDDADGDVFRRLQAHGFDFSRSYSVDYNVDFEEWPPSSEALVYLEREFGPLGLYAPEDDFGGYVQFQVEGPVTYERVMAVQARVSAAMEPYGGVCESWGVMQDAP